MNQPAEFNVRTTIEALRAVREADVVLSGIVPERAFPLVTHKVQTVLSRTAQLSRHRHRP